MSEPARNEDGTVAKGSVLNPTGKGGFQERPEDRASGRWNKEGSISYNYNKIMRMTPDELAEFIPTTMAEKIALTRVNQAAKDLGLADAKELADRTEGKAPQSLDLSSKDGSMTPQVIIEGVYAGKPNFRPSNEIAETSQLAEDSSN